jgi:hypothetical protein
MSVSALPYGNDLAVEIENALAAAVHRDSWSRKGKLYVSDLKYGIPIQDDGDCPKKLWAILRDEKMKPKSPGVDLMLHAGDRLHEAIAGWLKDNLIGDWKVVKVEEKLTVEGLSGRLDILLEHGPFKLFAVIDVKTKRGGAFGYLHHAKPADVAQIQAYMMAKDAHIGFVIYVDREGQNWIKIFVVSRHDARVTQLADKVKEIKRCAEAGEPVAGVEPILVRKENKGPDALYIKWPWQAEWCPLEKCYCKARAKKPLPKGIIGYVKNNGDLDLKEEHEHLHDWVTKKLEMMYV